MPEVVIYGWLAASAKGMEFVKIDERSGAFGRGDRQRLAFFGVEFLARGNDRDFSVAD
jgi:hypothetical protein